MSKEFKNLTAEQALKIIQDDEIVLQKFSMTTESQGDRSQIPYTNEGFEMDPEITNSMYGAMTKSNSSQVTVSFTDCRKLMGVDIIMTMRTPTHFKPWQKWVRENILEKMGLL